MLDVVVAGHVCLDIKPAIGREAAGSSSYLVPGRITEVGEATLSGGGAVSNTGLALHQLGARVRLVGRLGDDPLGRLTRTILGAHDPTIVEYLLMATGEPAGYTIVLAPPGVDRTFLTAPGPNVSFGAQDVPDSLLQQTRIFHLGYPPLLERMYLDQGAELGALMARARELGATTSLDMAMPDPGRPSGRVQWRAVLARTLPHVDIFSPSVEELLYCLHPTQFAELNRAARGGTLIDLVPVSTIRSLAGEALEMGAQIVLIKVGHRGAYLRTATLPRAMGRGTPADTLAWSQRELWSPAYRVAVAGTTGAGDATVGGFLLAILRGQTPLQAVNSACAIGASTCESADAVAGLGTWEDIQARLMAGWERLDAGIGCEGFTYEGASGTWIGPADRLAQAAGAGH